MDLVELITAVCEAREIRAALQVVADEIARDGGAASALWIDAEGTALLTAASTGWEPAAEVLDEVRARSAAGDRELAPDESPSRQPLHLLGLPVDEPAGTVVLVGPADAFESNRGDWQRIARAVAAVANREASHASASRAIDRITELEDQLKELRKGLEEGEVLHTLGLAANRSLDPDEVLELVTRLTRTALGASYVMVSTTEKGIARTPAAAGLRGEIPEHDPLAHRVSETGKTIRVGAGEKLRPEEFPAHADEGMLVGLGVPLSLYGETIGALVIGYRREVELTPRHVRLALTLAGHAAVAISNARLHRALATRTAEAERAYQELRWSAAAKERFFASLSHELRTPLNSALGYQSLILDGVAGEVPAAVRSFVENAHRATSGLLHLVSDVLDLSKIEAGKIDLSLEPVVLLELLQDAIAAVQPMADQKGLELLLDAGAGLSILTTDVNRVRQIVVNLLSNAVKFTDQGQVRLSAGVERAGMGGYGEERLLQIRVQDTGPGIRDEEQERIFHEFSQIGSASASEGTGLGLHISRQLARVLGGELHVQSRFGEGATFTLTLPLDGPSSQGTSIAPRAE